jgi:SAM-dependent methyltransferase
MKFNKICELEDWRLPYLAGYPNHRKCWEATHFMQGLRELGAIRPDGWALGVGAGHESPVFALTKYVRWVFCTDLYGSTDFAEADSMMLRDPDQLAPAPYNRRRLVVQHMDALDLRFEDETFDIVFSLSSVEHFGGIEGSKKALAETARVLKPGGIAALTTEIIVNEKDYLHYSNLQLFSPEVLCEFVNSATGLSPIEPIDFSISPATRATVMPFEQAISEPGRLPHIVLSYKGRDFTSISVFLRKAAC